MTEILGPKKLPVKKGFRFTEVSVQRGFNVIQILYVELCYSIE